MKILFPLYGRFDLFLAALTATLLHVAVLGMGFGILERVPVPEINRQDACESLSYLPARENPRILAEQPLREAVVREEPRELIPSETRTPIPSPESRNRERVIRECVEIDRTQKEETVRERVEVAVKSRVQEPEERWRKPVEPEGRTEIALSRAAAPSVEKGYRFKYPRLARRHNYEGRVEVKITVSPKGRVVGAEVVRSSGHQVLDDSALRQIKQVPFQPALSRAGIPIESSVTLGLDFTLEML